MPGAGSLYTDHLPGRTLNLQGEEYLYCSGTSYLGIAVNEEFRSCLMEGMARYGTNYSSSRNSNLQLQVYEEAESYLAAYTGAEMALTMSSGYLAGQALVQVLQGEGAFFYAPGTHPAVWQSTAEVPGTEQSFEDWVACLIQALPDLPEQHVFLVCNSLDPLQAKAYAFDWLSALPKEKQVTLIVDDSHGLGVTGKDGAGICRDLSRYANIRPVVVSSLGKALGVPAGVILGEKQLLERVKTSSFFGGASPAVPAYLYAFLCCGKVYQEARQKLYANIACFLQHLRYPDSFRAIRHYPVFSTQQEELCPFLLDNKVLISSFRYPTPADAPITRVILNSQHTLQDVQHLAQLINKFEQVPEAG
ncbi:7-keto-8-aminopelargonate synthetase-like enzyme [Pontibacter ummariensis]|uniref:7-keto-8-aminopelargonate synthetase n=1 Tax=Pontibacter ummariensis TaxID=1610492 RepID=A0A239BD72_9BACT|nr:aminotransferase class I/II-fold pyridoxal phosphate-dependent enzyme [Pontibacter ummariensis]PRY16478.1 7-keto-8-aminopelargonate synthetase-like enzyme [Pontibacter ummariensis]SNS05880.1 7-keto-8-aminopelargonate synthetase [Pontibacter ummariensis]